MQPVNILCMKWGTKFPPSYVNKLYGMVARNINLPFRFVCFTDDARGIRPEVEIRPLPQLDLPDGLPERGWRKLTVFAKDVGGLNGTALFLDLDVVIVDSIDDFFTYPGDFLIAPDGRNARKREGNSSVFRFEIGNYAHILEHFKANFDRIRHEVRHEQAYLSREIDRLGQLRFWPDSWVPSFKYHCIPPWYRSWSQPPFIPKDAKIILFHGLPNPPEAAKGVSGKWYRRFQPATWLEKYWKE